MNHRRTPARDLFAIAMILSLACCATEAAAQQRRSQMQVSCVVLPYISLQVSNQQPTYGTGVATLVIEPGEVQLTGKTNDLKSSEFVLTVSSDAPAVVNGIEVEPGREVEVGHYRYGNPIELKAEGAAPIRLMASR